MLLMIGVAAIVGVLFGLNFTVLILVPAVMGIAAVLTILGIVDGNLFPTVLRALVMIAVAMQMGYVLGCLLQFISLRVAGRRHTKSEATARRLE